MEQVRTWVLTAGAVVLALLILATLVRAVLGPRFTDRIVAVNVISTLVIAELVLLSVWLREDFLVDVALVFARSGLGIKHGIALSNGVGVIDSDYRGEIRVGLTNLSDTPYTVQPGDRIAQLAVMPVVQAELERVDSLDDTGRGTGGFGSTGK